jgi:hypothetical protein
MAQPVSPFMDLDVHFAFYVDDARVPAMDLMKDTTFVWFMDGRPARPDTAFWGGLSHLEFSAPYSDEHFFEDTLWMGIHRGTEQMSIAFPPGERPGHWDYTVSGTRIDFCSGSYLITELPKDLQLSGTLRGLDLTNGVPPFALIASTEHGSSASDLFNVRTGLLETTIPCSTYRENGMEWVRFQLIRRAKDREDTMHVRCQYRPMLDVDELEWMPGHYLWLFGKQRVDRTFPVGGFLAGNSPGTRIRILPNDPFDDERISIELKWQGRDLPLRSWFHTVLRKDGITEIRFQLAVATDGVVPAEVKERSWTLRISTVPAGRYVVTQERRHGRRMRQIDILMERELAFEVRHWE